MMPQQRTTAHHRIIPPPPPSWQSWEALMHLALDQAQLAAQSGEIPVGALVVNSAGTIIGKGYNQCIQRADPTAHAEIIAIQHAGITTHNYRLTGCFLVVTLEPCLMCAGAAIHARIAGIVYGAPDPKTGAVMSCIETTALPFHNHTPWHMGGICHDLCQQQLHQFFSQCRDS